MITIYGPEDTPERRVAERLKELAGVWAPQARSSGQTHIDIYCNVTKPGREYRDIDLLLSIWSERPGALPIVRQDDHDVSVESLVALVELKDHAIDRVTFTRTGVAVRYKSETVSVTEGLKKVPKPFKEYLEASGLRHEIWIGVLAWLTRVPTACVPTEFNNAAMLFADATFEDVLRGCIASGVSPVMRPDGARAMASCNAGGATIGRFLRNHFGTVLHPRRLGRKSFDVVFESWFAGKDYVKDIGKKLFIVRGGAGTGKTVVLLRMCRDLIEQHDQRIVFTSYNAALLSDLRSKMMAWKRVAFTEYLDDGRLSLVSIYELIASIGRILSVDGDGGRFNASEPEREAWLTELLKAYDSLGADARDLFAVGWNERYPDTFESTFIAIDEAQDVLPLERDLLIRVFGKERILVAFSDYQVSRVAKSTRWQLYRDSEQRVVKLTKVQRSFSLLTEFSKSFAQSQHLDTEDDRHVAAELSGGKIIVVEGDYFAHKGLHDEIRNELKELGNQPIDLLFLVPHKGGSLTPGSTSTLALLQEKGDGVWNGTDVGIRRTIQTDEHRVRLLHYQSGRGLEAWTVVARGLDTYYDWLMQVRPGFTSQHELFKAADEIEAHRQAIQRIMMPLTRAVHTLVIELRNPESNFADYLRSVTEEFGDDIAWIRKDVDSDALKPGAEQTVQGNDPIAFAASVETTSIPETAVDDRTESVTVGSPSTPPSGSTSDSADLIEAQEARIPKRTAYEGTYYELRGSRWVDPRGLTPPMSIVQFLNRAYEDAVASADQTLETADELTNVAREAARAGQLTRALRCARRALAINGQNEPRAAALVAILRHAKRHDEAIEVLRQYKGTECQMLIATGTGLLGDMGRWVDAAKILRRALRANPSPEVLAVRWRILSARPDLADVLAL